jgi:hypothetical protein
MTLNAADTAMVTAIAARMASEQIRNLARGTGGAVIPMPLKRPGTVGGDADAGQPVSVRSDGDVNSIMAVNATGQAVAAGSRVLIEWWPPNAVYVTNILDRAARGEWTPLWQGPGSSVGSVSTAGTWSRSGDLVWVNGVMRFNGAGSAGTALQMNGLPFPIRTSGFSSTVHGAGHFWNTVQRLGLTWVCAEGSTGGEVQGHLTVGGGGPAVLAPTTNTFPWTLAVGMELAATMVYLTDA